MGFFDHLQKKGVGAIQAQKAQIRKVECKQPVAKPSTALSVSRTRTETAAKPKTKPPVGRRSATSTSASAATLKVTSRSKSVPRKRPTPEQAICSSSDESDTEEPLDLRITKRAKVSVSVEPDLRRSIRDVNAFSGKEISFDMVHAADVILERKDSEYQSAFEPGQLPTTILLRYPGAAQEERYALSERR